MAHEPSVGWSRASVEEPETAGAALLQPKDYADLLSIARALASIVEYADVAAILVDEVRRVSGAARVAVWEAARDGELRLVTESTSGAPRRAGTVVVHRSSPEWDVMRTLEPVWLRARAEAQERYAAARLDPRGATRCEAWALLPAMAEGEAGRVLALAFAQPRPFDEHDRAVLGEIASASANALARGRLFTRERARADAAESARASLDEQFRRAEGLVSERTHLYERERFASGRLQSELSSTRDAADGLERALALLAALAAAADLLRLGSGAWLGVPISSGQGVVGTLSLTFRCARTFSVSERDRLIRLAVQCGAVLARGGALEAERTARPERLEPGS